MARIKVSSKFRRFWQSLAVIGGILLVIHSIYILLNLSPIGLFRSYTLLELVIGVGTIITDGWFLLKT